MTKQDKSLSRRDFLKVASVTGGAAAFLGSIPAAKEALASRSHRGLPRLDRHGGSRPPRRGTARTEWRQVKRDAPPVRMTRIFC